VQSRLYVGFSVRVTIWAAVAWCDEKHTSTKSNLLGERGVGDEVVQARLLTQIPVQVCALEVWAAHIVVGAVHAGFLIRANVLAACAHTAGPQRAFASRVAVRILPKAGIWVRRKILAPCTRDQREKEKTSPAPHHVLRVGLHKSNSCLSQV
jgi:hypothetical protein